VRGDLEEIGGRFGGRLALRLRPPVFRRGEETVGSVGVVLCNVGSAEILTSGSSFGVNLEVGFGGVANDGGVEGETSTFS